MKKKLGLRLMAGIIFLFAFGLFGDKASVGCDFLNPISVRADVKKLVCKADKLNVRVDAGTDASILFSNGKPVFMLFNEEAEVIGEKNGWYQVRFHFENKEVTGFVIGDFVEVSEIKTEKKKTEKQEKQEKPLPETTGIHPEANITTDALRVREDAGTGFPQAKVNDVGVVFRKNDTVIVTGIKSDTEGKRWYAVSGTFSGEIVSGYILSEYVKLNVSKKSQVPAYVLEKKGMTLKIKATNEKEIVTDKKGKKILLKKGTKVSIFHEVNLNRGKHFKISAVVKGKTYSGYVDATSLTFSTKKKTNKNTVGQKKENQKGEPGQTIEKEKTEEKKKSKIKKTEEEITVSDSEFKAQKGLVLHDNTELYSEPSEKAIVLMDNDKKVSYKLMKNHEVKVRKQYTKNSVKWYLITYEVEENGVKRSGAAFVTADKIGLTGELVAKTAGSYANEEDFSDKDFIERMQQEGFPDSYAEKLVELHEKHPNWNFKARTLLLDWEDAIAGENKLGLNLINNSKNVAWKSLKKGAYNWNNDSFRVFDGSSYVTASEKALRYFMDPRNFLNEEDIYQFELLSYQPDIHTEEEIEKILAGSPMEKKTYRFLDENGKEREMSYAETFLLAGVYSGVSPFYLASKVKLEVAGGGEFSKSAGGDVAGFEGIYNFYNIGANDSPLPLGAVMNGLNFAKNGKKERRYSDKISFNEYIKIPWTNPYKAILGGAAYIGDDYIKKGQDTVYLEKFNLTEFSTYSHQYMSNIEGPYRTAIQMRKAYKNLENLGLLFSIPVLQNMPEESVGMLEDEKNPNYYLKSLSVTGKHLSPAFSPEITTYTVQIGKKEKQAEILAEAVHKKAEIKGIGKVSLRSNGKTNFKIVVKAENGNERTYTISFIR